LRKYLVSVLVYYLNAVIFSGNWPTSSIMVPKISKQRWVRQRMQRAKAFRIPVSFPMHSMAQTRISSWGSAQRGMMKDIHFRTVEDSASNFLGYRKFGEEEEVVVEGEGEANRFIFDWKASVCKGFNHCKKNFDCPFSGFRTRHSNVFSNILKKKHVSSLGLKKKRQRKKRYFKMAVKDLGGELLFKKSTN